MDEALAELAAVVAEQPTDYFYQGMPEATLFAATALSGQHERARALIPTVVPWLPVAGRRNVHGAFHALEGSSRVSPSQAIANNAARCTR